MKILNVAQTQTSAKFFIVFKNQVCYKNLEFCPNYKKSVNETVKILKLLTHNTRSSTNCFFICPSEWQPCINVV